LCRNSNPVFTRGKLIGEVMEGAIRIDHGYLLSVHHYPRSRFGLTLDFKNMSMLNQRHNFQRNLGPVFCIRYNAKLVPFAGGGELSIVAHRLHFPPVRTWRQVGKHQFQVSPVLVNHQGPGKELVLRHSHMEGVYTFHRSPGESDALRFRVQLHIVPGFWIHQNRRPNLFGLHHGRRVAGEGQFFILHNLYVLTPALHFFTRMECWSLRGSFWTSPALSGENVAVAPATMTCDLEPLAIAPAVVRSTVPVVTWTATLACCDSLTEFS